MEITAERRQHKAWGASPRTSLSRTVVDGLLAGKHRSTTKGGCCEFAQHRQYAFGDEVRQIDWQVYARNDRYFIRQFEEETNLHGIVAVDTSGSMRFGLSTVTKLEYAKRAAACLARLLLRQRDAVGAVILNETNPLFVPPRQNAAHLQAVLAALRDEYLKRLRAFLDQLEELVTGLGGDYVRLTTSHDLADSLGWFLRSRMARR